ncbi:MAG TPA: PadR family transcriptional regulator [Ruminiclostridium sp.]|nr:PadR family transcriptional regulator [Ruminiclostridium sp.]
MVRLLILYYLSLKSTHGYEIQKFIQLNHMEEWNSIQSGSIYYAMSKLEAEGLIKLVGKMGGNEKSKRVFDITEAGRHKLSEMAFHELEKPLSNFSSDKFLIYPIVANLSKPEMTITINKHISSLQKKLSEINDWYDKKQGKVTNIEKASFKYMRETVQNQIDWHRSFLDNIDETIAAVSKITDVIKAVDFSSSDDCSIFYNE